MADIQKPTELTSTTDPAISELSQAFDKINAAGLQDLKIAVDADATIGANSTAKSVADSENVSGSSTSVSEVLFNSGLQATASGTNTASIKADAGLSGIATTTAQSSAATADGTATAFTTLGEAAGIQDLDSLQVGGELTALGKSLNTLGASAENVTGAAKARSEVSKLDVSNNQIAEIQGFEGTEINVKSDATLQGLAQLSNSAAASTSAGDATAESFAAKLQGADLQGLNVGGVASVTGQATLSNLSTAETVVETSLGANALSSLGTAQGLVADGKLADLDGVLGAGDKAAAGVTVSSDASLTGLASITNNATGSTTKGDAGAQSLATGIEGASLNTVQIGGVGTIGGQATYSATAKSENVDGGQSTAKADLSDLKGLINSNIDLNNDGDSSDTGETAGKLDVKSDASIQGLASITNNATASGTTATNGLSDGNLVGASAVADATNLQGAVLQSDTNIGGIGSIKGQVSFSTTADADNVTGSAKASAALGAANGALTGGTASGLTTGVDATGAFGTDIKSDATIQGLSSLNVKGLATTTDGVATADAYAGTVLGADLGDVQVGGIANMLGQTNLTSLSDANSVSNNAISNSKLGTAEGLNIRTGVSAEEELQVASDATIQGLTTINSTANADTTKGVATANAFGTTINGADLSAGNLDIGGLGTIKGQANFGLTAEASNVEGGAASATAGSATTGFDLSAAGLKGGVNAAGVSTEWGMDVASDAGLTGMAIGSLKADASSTADAATAISGAGDSATGALLPSLNVGGLANLTAAAQLDSASTAKNVGTSDSYDAIAEAGIGQKVTGLTSGESSTVNTGTGDYLGSNLASVLPTGSETHAFGTGRANLNINVASDATLSAQGFSNLDATAASTAGDAFANAGFNATTANSYNASGANSTVTGIASDMDIKVGGIGNLTALAQGTADASAESVTGDAKAFSVQAANGALELEMQTMSDATLSSTAKVVGSADAMSTGNLSTVSTTIGDEAWASMDFDATGIEGLALGSGGVGNLSATANVIGTANAEGVASLADARGSIDAIGMSDVWMTSASDGTVSGVGLVNAGVSAKSTADTAKAEGDFDATAIDTLQLGVGGIATLKGQAQVIGNVSAESVSGNADAFSGKEGLAAINGGPNFSVDASTIYGLKSIELDGASNGTVLGTASGTFNTSAESVLGNANAQASQVMKGINSLNLDLGGNGGINAIVNDTNFVSAHSVSGNATAVASVDAIGLDGGNIHIAGNATILANVGVDSKAEAGTIG